MKLKDVPFGAVCYTSERLGDDKSNMEVREVFYIRDPDGPCRHPHNVRIARIGIAQGNASEWTPRYARKADPPCRDPGEADGRTPVQLVGAFTVWAEFLGVENANL